MTATDLHDCFAYVDCDIPEGVSIAQWRRERTTAVRPPRRHALRRLLHRAT